jgi:predicted CxxxxCH...CXXCH cytochrome family protein
MQIQVVVKAKNSAGIATINEFGVIMKRYSQILIWTILSLSIVLISCNDVRKDPLPTATSDISKNYSPYNCTQCHGSVNAAPPKDLSGNTAISSPGVGAHQAHLLASDFVGATVACNECHLVPTVYDAPGHLDATPGAEVIFQGAVTTSRFSHIAGADTAATFSNATLQCANTYCHGYFPNGNKVSPVWNDETGQYRACGSCHGDPTKSTTGERALPKTRLNGGTHLSLQDNANILQCYRCHPSAIDSNYKLNQSKHINGQVDF